MTFAQTALFNHLLLEKIMIHDDNPWSRLMNSFWWEILCRKSFRMFYIQKWFDHEVFLDSKIQNLAYDILFNTSNTTYVLTASCEIQHQFLKCIQKSPIHLLITTIEKLKKCPLALKGVAVVDYETDSFDVVTKWCKTKEITEKKHFHPYADTMSIAISWYAKMLLQTNRSLL